MDYLLLNIFVKSDSLRVFEKMIVVLNDILKKEPKAVEQN